jgi:AmmeMemoRadiSam system protein A
MIPKSNDYVAPVKLTDKDQRVLLQLARATLTQYLEHRRKASPGELGLELPKHLQVRAGAFVSLHKRGQLRGCIGEILPERALCEVVQDHALNAGLRDPRFRPVQPDEMGDIEFEISVLTPPERISSWEEIEVGTDGVVMYKDGRHAVFLPQVATEQGWDVEEMLTHLSMKAGLSPDDWKRGAQFEIFQAIVFGESRA